MELNEALQNGGEIGLRKKYKNQKTSVKSNSSLNLTEIELLNGIVFVKLRFIRYLIAFSTKGQQAPRATNKLIDISTRMIYILCALCLQYFNFSAMQMGAQFPGETHKSFFQSFCC